MQAILHFPLLITLLFFITTNIPQTGSANFKHGLRGNHSDQQALLAIKAEVDDPHSALSSWNKSLHFCMWEGVFCRKHQRVVRLDLSDSNLVGTLSPFIGNLSFLRKLNLSFNSFQGHIPQQVSYLSRLRKLILEENNFEGEIPANLSRCLHLKVLFLGYNNLKGKIPKPIVTLASLTALDVSQNQLSGSLLDIGIGNISTAMDTLFLCTNNLEGSIPNDIGNLKGLGQLCLGENKLSGIIPDSLFNLSNLFGLDLSQNKLHGHLPQDIGLRLPLLSDLLLVNCSLTGQFPISIFNLSKIVQLELELNHFEGKFSINGNNLPHLLLLNLRNAFSLRGEARDLKFVDSLTNFTSLIDLNLAGNSFIGNFPPSILNLSTGLYYLALSENQIVGKVPIGLGKFVNLSSLWLDDNHLTGPIPTDIGKIRSIESLNLANNYFSGEFPSSIGNLTNLYEFSVEDNNVQGPISFWNCKKLKKLYLSNNNFSGSFPIPLFHSTGLLELYLSQNKFEGSLPIEINSLKNLDQLDVSQNRFSGEIPSTLADCISVTYIDMSHNLFSGQIPKYFSTWPSLSYLNLSFNNLSGEVSTNGIFADTSVISVVGNDKLCGGVPTLHLPSCPRPKKRRLSSTMIMIISIACALTVVLLVALCFYFIFSSRKKKDPPSRPENTKLFLEVSYQMLHMATNGFSLSNLLGSGAFGSVYKGILCRDDTETVVAVTETVVAVTETVVAVKVMNLQNDGASKSFIAECKALRNIRHRNLVKVITACSSIDAQRRDFKALVYEFMPRGSLEHWLQLPNHVHDTSEHGGGSLSLLQRLSITIDVASAVEYLHIGCSIPIIHCDLKPSNILLDDEMIAHVSDFGLAKFISGASTSSIADNASSTQVRGTVGYAAPEYGIGSKVSPEGDIYSLGIVILELMTSKKPTDVMFNDTLNLHDFANAALLDRVMEIIDHRMLGDTDVLRARSATDFKKKECIKSIIMIGVQCSMELPHERMNLVDVVNELKSTRKNLLTRRV